MKINGLLACIIAIASISLLMVIICIWNGTNKGAESDKLNETAHMEYADTYNQIDTILSVQKSELSPQIIGDASLLYDKYVDSNDTEYLFKQGTDHLVGFVDMSVYKGANATAKYGKEQLSDIAYNVASKFVKNISEYDVRQYYYQQDTGIHKFYYTHSIDDYLTTQTGSVFITPAGEIQSVMFLQDGKFDSKSTLPTIDKELLSESLDSLIRSSFDDINDYEIVSCTLDIVDEKWIMQYLCECTNIDGNAMLEQFEIELS